MQYRVALVACDNGLGHVRRMVLLALALQTAGQQPTLVAPRRLVDAFATRWPASRRLALLDYEARLSAADLRVPHGGMEDRIARLPDLTTYDAVVSDNLLEVLAVRSDTILSGGFLWHRALPDIDAGYVEACERLLSRQRPPMVSTQLMSAPYLGSMTNLHEVGLFAPRSRRPANPRGVLIAAGGGGEFEEAVREFVARLAHGPSMPVRIAIDAKLSPRTGLGWLEQADFGREPNFEAGLVRPGVGTVTDLLWQGARPFCVREAANHEMADNAAALASAGVGEDYGSDLGAGLNAILSWLADPRKRRSHTAAWSSLSFHGVAQAMEAVLDHIRRGALRDQ